MVDPNTVPYYAYRTLREQDGKFYYFQASPHLRWVKLFGFDDPIVKVSIRERLPTDPPSNYWGWLATDEPDRYQYVWPSEGQMEMCFPYGSKAEADRGRGRKVNLVIEELPEGA